MTSGQWIRSGLFTATLCAVAPALFAQTLPAAPGTVYRCAHAQGPVTYSQQACAEHAQVLKVQDDRSAAQIHQSMTSQARDVQLAKRQSRHRQHLERVGSASPAKPLTVIAHHRAAPKPGSTKDISTKPDDARAHRHRPFKAVVPTANNENTAGPATATPPAAH
jgi:hypothetical protein